MKVLQSLVLAALVSLSYAAIPAHNTARDKDDDNPIPLKVNAKNQACVTWYDIRDEIMGTLFHGSYCILFDVRYSLHFFKVAVMILLVPPSVWLFMTAGTFSLARKAAGQVNGGPDGSLLWDPEEVNRPENNGLQAIVSSLTGLPAKYGVSHGDVLQLAGTLGAVACPGGPQIKTYIGRAPADHVNPDGLLPDTRDTVPNLVARFADQGFSVRELMALIGAHTAGRQRFVELIQSGNTFDTTYRQTANPSDSDRANGLFPTTSKDYSRFIGKQDNWAREYADAHEKMSLLGLDKNSLTDCTEIMPLSIDLKDRKDDDDLVVNCCKIGRLPSKLIFTRIEYRSIWLTM
ncbi:heme peroxidase [Flagelloscypha sp. PMI_526]|nr:heme peroxidase [Flagelloscypha sp. PMI_526]